MNNRTLNRPSVPRPAPRRTIGALLVSAALTVPACGDGPSDGRPADAAGIDPVAAWQVYYDLTHPDPETSTGSDPLTAWQVYYDLTHPDPGTSTGSDPLTAWQVYYDLTHPDPGTGTSTSTGS